MPRTKKPCCRRFVSAFISRKFVAEDRRDPRLLSAGQERPLAGLEVCSGSMGIDLMALVSYDPSRFTRTDKRLGRFGYVTIVGRLCPEGHAA